MTIDNILVLGILLGAVLLFISEKVRIDIVALLVLLALTLTGLLSAEEAFSGFSSPAVITVWAVFIVSAGLTRSGVADAIARLMIRLAGRSPARLLVIVMLTVGFTSAFMNNIGAVAILLPAVVSVSRDLELPPSKLLIPLAWASLLGGNMTLIGTPPNILAAGILESYGEIESFAFFDFTPTGVIVLATGILYMLLIGRHLLPARTPGGELTEDYALKDYLAEVEVQPDSLLLGRTVMASELGENYDLNVIQLHLPDGRRLAPTSDHRLAPGDRLLVEASVSGLLETQRKAGLAPITPGVEELPSSIALEEDLKLVEVVVAPNSALAGKKLKQIDFRTRYGLSILAIRHHGRTLRFHLGDVRLSFGDSLLVAGPADRADALRREPDFLLLEPPAVEPRRRDKAPLALAILAGVLMMVTTGWLSIAPAMLSGAVLMVLSGALRMEEAYRAIEWKSVFLIAGMLPLGLAMETTGTARLMAGWIIELVGGWGLLAVLMGVFVLTALLTEVMSNAAATVLVVPIAIDAALGLGANPHAFVMAVVLAASTSFLMPIGHQVNVLVYGPGGYRFTDYTRVGVWLNLLLFAVIALTLPLIWPL